MSVIVLPENYVVHVSLTKGRQILAVAGFNQRTANVAYQLLCSTPVTRYEMSHYLKDAIDDGKKEIAINGVVFGAATMELLALACLLHSNRLETLKQDLDRIVKGTAKAGDILKPGLWADGFRPK